LSYGQVSFLNNNRGEKRAIEKLPIKPIPHKLLTLKIIFYEIERKKKKRVRAEGKIENQGENK